MVARKWMVSYINRFTEFRIILKEMYNLVVSHKLFCKNVKLCLVQCNLVYHPSYQLVNWYSKQFLKIWNIEFRT